MGKFTKHAAWMVLGVLAAQPALADPPADDWANYFSGGRARVGGRVTIPGIRGEAFVIADQVVVQPGNDPSRHQYVVVISGEAGRYWDAQREAALFAPRRDPLRDAFTRPVAPPPIVPRPAPFGMRAPPATDLASRLADFDARIATVEIGRDGTVRMIGWPTSVRSADTHFQNVLDTYLSTVMQATAEGRALDARARALYQQFATRADATRNRYMTAQGYGRIAGDIAVASFQPRATQRLGPVGNFISTTLQSSAVNAIGSVDLPVTGMGSQPPFGPGEAAAVSAARDAAGAVQNNRASIQGYLRERLGMPRGGSAALTPAQRSRRDEILANLAIQFAGRMAAQGEGVTPDAVASEALAAIEDLAVEYALPRVPVVTVLARDALELTRQLRGFVSVIHTANRADERFTAAINAFHESYAARQYFAQSRIAADRNFQRMLDSVRDGEFVRPGVLDDIDSLELLSVVPNGGQGSNLPRRQLSTPLGVTPRSVLSQSGWQR